MTSGITEFDSLLLLGSNADTFTITNKKPLKNSHFRSADRSQVEYER